MADERDDRAAADLVASTGEAPAAVPDPDLAQVVAERDALRQHVAALETRVLWRKRLRRWGATLLVILTCLSFTGATVGLWARRNLLNTPVFVDRVGPLVRDPVMQEAISRIISDQAIQAIDPRRLVAEALPERGQILAGPISAAVESFIRTQVERFVSSDQFERLWAATVEQAHRGAVALLEGKSSQFASAAGGEVTLNLVPIIDAVLAEVGKLSPEILGHSVTLPTLTVSDAPDAAVRRLESALGINLRDGYGEVTVFDADELSAVQDAVKVFNDLTVLLVVATLLFLGLSLWVSPSRRRTLLQLCVGIAIGIVLVRRTSFYVENRVLDMVKVPDNEAAVQLLVDTFFDPLRAALLWIVGGLGVVAAGALVSGPYPWAVRLRAILAGGAQGVGSLVTRGARGARDPRAAAWLREHRDRVRIAEAAAAIIALLFLSLPWLVILLLAAVVIGIELLIAAAAPDQPDPPPEGPSPPAEVTSAPS